MRILFPTRDPARALGGVVSKCSWAGEVRDVLLLVAIGVYDDGYREILGIVEDAQEGKKGWSALGERGLEWCRTGHVRRLLGFSVKRGGILCRGAVAALRFALVYRRPWPRAGVGHSSLNRQYQFCTAQEY